MEHLPTKFEAVSAAILSFLYVCVIIFSLFQWLYQIFKEFLTICALILRKYNIFTAQ